MNRDTLCKLHEYELKILDELDRICSKYNLKYYLAFGTLLGAVRHHGFIPWDDDVDVCMPREDYEKLSEIVDIELKDGFFFQSEQTDAAWCRLYSKIRIDNTLFIESKVAHVERHQGIFIDVFPLDKTNKKGKIYEAIKQKYVNVVNAQIIMSKGELPINWKHKIMRLILPNSIFYRIREKWKCGKGEYYVGYGGVYGVLKETMPISCYDPPIKLEFEGKEYSAPRNYEYILTHIYGKNYMTLPPENERITHNPIRLSFDINGPDEVLDD